MNRAPDMELVATLVAGSPEKLSPEILRDAAAHVEKSGGKSVRAAWLAEAEAADIFCGGLTVEGLRAHLTVYLKEKPLDVIVQPVAARRKKLLLADMESTIIEQEMLEELAGIIGRRAEVAAITHRAMNGEIDFVGALRERVAMLKGQPVSILDHVAERMTFMPGAAELLAAMKAQGAACWLVSGGFTVFTDPVAAKLGFDKVFANTLVLRDGVIAGEVAEPILDKNAKKTLLEKACAELGLSLAETLTVGDGANDVPMLAACNAGGGLGIAYRAKPNVRAAIPNQVNHTDLKVLIYAQGEG